MNIDDIKRRVLIKYPLFGDILDNADFIETDKISTAATNGKAVFYNTAFLNSITDEEKVFVLAHEVSHIAFEHMYRLKGKNQNIWNRACDAVINAFLSSDGLPIFEGAINMPEAINYTAEEMYEKLMKDHNDISNEDKDFTASDHSLWQDDFEKDSSMHNNKQENNRHSNSPSVDKNDDAGNFDNVDDLKEANKNGIKEKKLSEETKKLTELGEKEVFEQNRIEKKKRLQELKEILAKESKKAGNDTNSEVRDTKDIGVANQLIDWRRVLKETIKYEIDWSYQNAGIEENVVTPYLEEKPKPETEIVLDTSGSINNVLLKNFLIECKNIIKISKVKVGCFDTKFYGFTEIKKISDIDKMKFVGGGGTDFDVAVNAFSKRVENKIIFTDGEAKMPDKKINIIWIVFGNQRIEPPGGKVIYIDDNQLKKLKMVRNK